MSLKLVANNKQTNIDNFTIELPETSLKLDTIHLEYDSLKAFDRFTEQVHFSFRTLPSQVTLKDISPFVPILSHFTTGDVGYGGEGNCGSVDLFASGDYSR